MKGVRGTKKCICEESREQNQKEEAQVERKSNGNRGRSQKKKCLTGAVAEVKERISDGSFRRINGKRHVPNESFERKEACAQEELRDDTRACF